MGCIFGLLSVFSLQETQTDSFVVTSFGIERSGLKVVLRGSGKNKCNVEPIAIGRSRLSEAHGSPLMDIGMRQNLTLKTQKQCHL